MTRGLRRMDDRRRHRTLDDRYFSHDKVIDVSVPLAVRDGNSTKNLWPTIKHWRFCRECGLQIRHGRTLRTGGIARGVAS